MILEGGTLKYLQVIVSNQRPETLHRTGNLENIPKEVFQRTTCQVLWSYLQCSRHHFWRFHAKAGPSPWVILVKNIFHPIFFLRSGIELHFRFSILRAPVEVYICLQTNTVNRRTGSKRLNIGYFSNIFNDFR